jgi:hypothetical protein
MYTLRRAERYTNWEATKAVELNPENFRDLTVVDPYEGETEQDFVDYVQYLYHEDFYEVCEKLEDIGHIDDADALSMLFEGEMEIYSSTTDKYATEWFDIGEEDAEYRKWGGFNVRHSTLED